jgi:bacterioferritin
MNRRAASGIPRTVIELLNEDLAREYQAIIAYVVYSQMLKGAEYMAIAKELEKHAGEELQHALMCRSSSTISAASRPSLRRP